MKKRQNHHKGELYKMAKKSGEQKEHIQKNEETGEETKYIFQYPGFREVIKMRDRSKNQLGTGIVEETWYGELMKHVIVNPKMSWDNFEEHNNGTEVLAAANTFLSE